MTVHKLKNIIARITGAAIAAVLLGNLAVNNAFAQTATQKLAPELVGAINNPSAVNMPWVSKVKGDWKVKVMVVANDLQDPELQGLRTGILNAGGSVYYKYISVNAVSAMLPVSQLFSIASRSDVATISPNRAVAKTASFVESITGAELVRASTPSVRGVNGTGVGVAIIDSGIMSDHLSFVDSLGNTRVRKAANLLDSADAAIGGSKKGWEPGIDFAAALYPSSKTMLQYLKRIDRIKSKTALDGYGHGTHVASIAAGAMRNATIDIAGLAPAADIYDLKVLDDNGIGDISDAIAAIDWAIYHQYELNIRVINLSIASDSTESYLTDPLCRAARAAVASGITVVVAAGNFGKSTIGEEVYGSISAPGNEPSVITVGSANPHNTAARADDTVNFFSSRGPTRGGYVNASGVRVVDNVLKPELVAPGNLILGASAADGTTNKFLHNNLRANNPGLGRNVGSISTDQVMALSGTSIAAPHVAGTVALLLQANPSLTPPLIKAVLQYTAQPLPDANLMQQGAGLLNAEGAVRLASALRQDIDTASRSGALTVGSNMLAAGKTFPVQSSTISTETFNWSRLVFVGGSQIVSGEALFTKYQGIYDPRMLWVRSDVRMTSPIYWPVSSAKNADLTPRVRFFNEDRVINANLLSAGVLSANELAGATNFDLKSGLFSPTAIISNGVTQGTGRLMAETLRATNMGLLGSSSVIGSGITFPAGATLGTGKIMAEGLIMGEGKVMGESGGKGRQSIAESAPTGE